MNITTRAVFRHFLQKLRLDLSDPKVVSIDPFFQSFFTTYELRDIVSSMFGVQELEELEVDTLNKEKLLDTIGDDAVILNYFLERWEDELIQQSAMNKRSVEDTLFQLNLDTHYLGRKDLDMWDAYDLNNFRSLQVKAGRICRVYGIYDATVEEADADDATSPMQRFFESKELARAAMQEMIVRGPFQEDELHILSLYASK